MLSKKQLFEEYQAKGLIRGKEIYFTLPVAYDFVDNCQDNNLAVIGVEGFRMIGKAAIQPDLGLIADYSSPSGENWIEFRDSCNAEAKLFLEELKLEDAILLNISVISKNDWIKD